MTHMFRFIALFCIVFGACFAYAQEADSENQASEQQEESIEEAASASIPIEETQYGAWTVVCYLLENDQRFCNMQQTITNSQGISVARISVRAEDDLFIDATAEIITPLGTQLSKGVGLRIDSGEAQGFPFEVCVIEGCVAIIQLTHDQVERMRLGSTIAMAIQEFGKANPVSLEVSLMGFTKAFSLLTK